MSALYSLIVRQWQRGRINEDDLQKLADDGRITEEEKTTIMEIEQD